MADARTKSGSRDQGKQSKLLPKVRSPRGRWSYLSWVGGLGFVFLFILLTLLVLGLALRHKHQTVGRLIERIITVEEPTSAAAYEMEINVVEVGLAVVKYVASGDPQQRERATQDEEDFRKFKLQYDRLTDSQEEKELGRQIDAVYNRYRTFGRTLMETRDRQASLIAQVAEGFWRIDETLDDKIQASLERTSGGQGKLQESANLEADVAEVGTWLGNYLSTSNPAYRERILDNLQDVRGHLTAFQKLMLSPSERQWSLQLELLFQQTATNIHRILATADALRSDEVEFIRLRGQLDDLLDEGAQALIRRDLTAVHSQAKDTIQRLHLSSMGLLAASALICAGAAAVIIHRSLRLHNEVKLRQVSETARAQLLEQLVSTQEQERGRLARELHDQLGQDLSALVLGLKELEQSNGTKPSTGLGTPSGSKLLQELGGRLIEHLHTIAWELRPAALDDLGLHGALSSYLEDWTRRSRVPVDFHSELHGERLPGPIETTLYRVAQEALTNVMKHAKASSISLVLQRRGPEVVMVVEDNGCGFVPEEVPPSSAKGRLGLLGMKERARLAGGVLDVESSPGAGTTLVVRIPVGRSHAI